jgi:hypothetical protein
MTAQTISEQNPAIAVRTAIPPALVEAVMSDAAAAQPAIRAQALVQLHELHVMRHNMTPNQRMQLAELTSKLGDMTPKAQKQEGGGGNVVINFIRNGDKGVTIEANALTIDE